MAIGFTAELSHYTSTGTYAAQAGMHATVAPLSLLPTEHTAAAHFGLPAVKGMYCSPCYQNETGDCVSNCVYCPPGKLPDGCSLWTRVCASGACPCPPGRE